MADEFVQSNAIQESITEMMADLTGGEAAPAPASAAPVVVDPAVTPPVDPVVPVVVDPVPDTAPAEDSKSAARVTALYGQMSQLENELRKVQAENKTLKSGSSIDDLKSRAAKDKFGVLKQLGINIDSMFEEWIAQPSGGASEAVGSPDRFSSNEVSEVKAQLAELQERVKEMRALEDRKNHDTRVGEYISDIKKEIIDGGDRWVCVREKLGKGGEQAALNLSVKVYEQTNIVPDIKEVLDQLEEFYYNEVKDAADILAKKTGSKKVAPAASSVTPAAPSKQPVTIMDSGGSTETDDDLTPEQLIAKLARELES